MTFTQLVLPPNLLMHGFASHTLQLFTKHTAQTHLHDNTQAKMSDFQSTNILHSGEVEEIPL